MTTFGTKLRKLREAKGLTQAEAAELVGIPTNTWASYEPGNSLPQPRQVAISSPPFMYSLTEQIIPAQ